jgi:undecaprenyl-diphosphatase
MHITLIEALILGVVQGLTEFLPVSSSAHLVIFQNIFGLKEPIIFFDICLHLGTLLAVVLFLKDDLKAIIIEAVKLFIPVNGTTLKQSWNTSPYARFAFLAVLATIPTALIGFLFKDTFEALFSSVPAVGSMLIVTGVILLLTKKVKNVPKEINEITILDSLIIGVAQGFAIAPGISRSGTTISFGIFRGINQEIAARFSFLLSIPAILGATVVKFDSSLSLNEGMFTYLGGTMVAAITGYLSLKLLSSMIRKGHLYYFSPYCFAVGSLALLTLFL